MTPFPSAVVFAVVGLLAVGGCAAPSLGDPACEFRAEPAAGLSDLAGPVSEAMFDHTDRFGGKPWLDRDGRFVLHVPYVGDLASAQALLADAIPPNLPVEWQQVRYSEAQMEAAEREIFDVPAGMQGAVNSISLDSCSNRVIIKFADHDYPDLRHALAEKYGDMVVFGVEPKSQPL